MVKRILAIALAFAVVAPCVKADVQENVTKDVVVTVDKVQADLEATFDSIIKDKNLTDVEKQVRIEKVAAETLESLPGSFTTGDMKKDRLVITLVAGAVATAVVGTLVVLGVKNKTANVFGKQFWTGKAVAPVVVPVK